MGLDKWSLLSRLRAAVKKVSYLLNLNVNRWRIASMISRTSSSNHRYLRTSFNNRLSPPGLAAACADDETGSEDSGSSRGGGHLQRTRSYPTTSEDDQDDIDQRAEIFIANFRNQLRMERQISLKLRYCRGNSFELSSP